MANQPAKQDETRAWMELQDGISRMAEASPIEAFDIASVVLDQIANAQTPEEIFAANESGPGDVSEYLGQTLQVLDPRYSPSAEKFRKGTLGFYVVFDAVTPSGERVTLSCGAPNVVGSIYRLQRLGMFDDGKTFPLMLKGRETPNGTLYTVHAG